MRHRVGAFLRGETILIVATLLALISCFIVPPDRHYSEHTPILIPFIPLHSLSNAKWLIG